MFNDENEKSLNKSKGEEDGKSIYEKLFDKSTEAELAGGSAMNDPKYPPVDYNPPPLPGTDDSDGKYEDHLDVQEQWNQSEKDRLRNELTIVNNTIKHFNIEVKAHRIIIEEQRRENDRLRRALTLAAEDMRMESYHVDDIPTCACGEFYGRHHPECPVKRIIDAHQSELTRLRSQLAEAQRDAERYRWLQKAGDGDWVQCSILTREATDNFIDAAIDAERSKTP